jgi:hypothetical protein
MNDNDNLKAQSMEKLRGYIESGKIKVGVNPDKRKALKNFFEEAGELPENYMEILTKHEIENKLNETLEPMKNNCIGTKDIT